MIDGSTRRLPNWLAVGDERKKKTAEESPTLPRNSVSLANNGTKRKKGNLFKHDNPPHAAVKISGGNKRKRKAKNVVIETHEEIKDEDALTVEDLVSIAQEYVKDSEDSEPSLLLSSTNDLDGSNEQQSSRASIDSTVNLTSEQNFSNFDRTDDPAHDMLNLLLGPLLPKPQRNEINLDIMSHKQQQQPQKNDFREETVPLTKKKSSLKDKVSFFLD